MAEVPDVEFWWVVSELTDFEAPAPRLSFPVSVKMPDGCIGFFAVFDGFADALKWADGNSSKVQCLRVQRGSL